MTEFEKKVYEIVARIPKGKVATYGQVAVLAGFPNAARAVGNILHKNTNPSKVPCHRVVNSNGNCLQNFAFGGVTVQIAKLKSEGVIFKNETNLVDLTKCFF